MNKCTLITFLASFGITLAALAAPEPAIIQGPEEWTLSTEFQHLQQISVRLANEERPRRYWYLILSVTNDSGRDVGFYPECVLMTDTFELTATGDNVPVAIFERIKQRYQEQYPFLEYVKTTTNKVLQGKDNTKDIAIIWPDFDSEANAVNLFISGLSNETVEIEHPALKDEKGHPVMVYLRKTLKIDYKIGGAPQLRQNAKVSYEEHNWVMR